MSLNQEFNSNGFQAPRLQDYIKKIKEYDVYTKIKIKIPHNFNERITWQPFEDKIITDHIDKYIDNNTTFFKDIANLNDLKEKTIDTEDFFNGKEFGEEWSSISFVLWDTNLNNYLELISLIKNNNIENIPEHLHYLVSRSSTIISLPNLLKKRRPIMIKKRWLNVLDPYLKKGKWSKDEDELLLQKYSKYGPLWSKIASEVPRRTVDQCSKRFHEALDPEKDLKNYVDWKESEDIFLINTMNTIGTKWRTIALDLSKTLQSNRSALNCRNRWRALINSYIRNKDENNKVHMLLAELTTNGEFEDMVKLREKLAKQSLDKKKKREMKEQKKILKMKGKKNAKKESENENDSELSEDDDLDEEEAEESNYNQSESEYKNMRMTEGEGTPFNGINSFLIKEDRNKYSSNGKNYITDNNKLNDNDNINTVDEGANPYQWSRMAPSLTSNNLDQQFDPSFAHANSMSALSPGPYHMPMSPPPANINLMQTPKPHDIISSLRTTQNNIVNSPPSLLSNLVSANVNNTGNMNDVLADESALREDSNTNTSNHTINKHVNKTFLQKSHGRPNSVPLKNNTTEWKFQLKQKNLTLSSGNITNEKLVSLLIEQAKLNNLKISIHQHIHNHYVPILDNSEQENNSSLTTPESTVHKFSNNSISSSNSSNNYGNRIVKDMNEIGGYRTRHFKHLDSVKVPKLGSSTGVKRKGSVTGSSPRRNGSVDMSGKSVQADKRQKKGQQFGLKNTTTSEESEENDFFNSLMSTNGQNTKNESEHDDLYYLGFNPS